VNTTDPTVEQIAAMYAEEFADIRRAQALAPLGLTYQTFSTVVLPPAVTDIAASRLANEKLGCRAIIAGVDQLGAQLYVVQDPGTVKNYTLDGWASIGIGSRHADLQFIAENHNRDKPFEDSLLLTYLAKKKADITPGVGVSTDVFWITATEGYRLLAQTDPTVVELERAHKSIEKSQQRIRSGARVKVQDYIKKVVSKQQEIQAQTPTAESDIVSPAGDASSGENAKDAPV
jgi:hypothetical protein